ncbi:SLOG family protein [Micromonospora sp. 15K316]|uniref:SLOG family protein n=1 Tax=Micromonospora sp. 15K316 TaxID=2530376 RepID=UPI00140444C9|nr:SLOG family protein [Micromonospora sp. 15K316]
MSAWEVAAATGHRPQHLTAEERRWIRAELKRIAVKLRDEHGTATGVSGMALGTDLWWADETDTAGMKLWAHVPFPQQPNPWRDEDKTEWRRLLDRAAKVTTYGDHYDVKLLHARNDGMLAAGSVIVAVHKRSKTTGGTASAVRKAERLGLPIIRIDPERRTVTLSPGATHAHA